MDRTGDDGMKGAGRKIARPLETIRSDGDRRDYWQGVVAGLQPVGVPGVTVAALLAQADTKIVPVSNTATSRKRIGD